MPEFMIRYIQHEYIWIVIDADSKEEAIEKFKDGSDIDWSDGRGYGDYLENTFENIAELDENGKPMSDI